MMLDLDEFVRRNSEAVGREGSASQEKQWINLFGVNMLVKVDSSSLESTKEKSVSEILTAAGLYHADYDIILVKYRGIERSACISRSFLKDGEASISLYDIIRDIPLNERESARSYFDKAVKEVNERLGISAGEVEKYLLTLLTVDYLVMNTDRHLKNIEFIRDAKGKWDTAPMYDFGKSFLGKDSWISQSEFTMAEYKSKSKPFSTSPEKNLIDIEYAKEIGYEIKESIGDLDKLQINAWHKNVFKHRMDRLLGLREKLRG